MIPEDRGTYALLLRLHRPRRLRVGKLGVLPFAAGYYVYIGSAFGPGGLHARIAHHRKRSPSPHWHIDFLRRITRLEDVRWVTGRRIECEWAQKLAVDSKTTPVNGFGCSDCGCGAHLFYIKGEPAGVWEILGA